MKIIIGSSSKKLGKLIAKNLNVDPCFIKVSRFPDGEINIYVKEEDIINQEIYIVHSISPPVNENFMELLITIDTVKRFRAKKIVAIIPYCGYSRQDRIIRTDNMQSALSAKLSANLIQSSGADLVAVVDLHSNQIEGFFDVPIVNLNCFEVFLDFINKDNLLIVAPDFGSVNRARVFAKILEKKHKISLIEEIIIIDKYRERECESKIMNIIGEVKNKNCVIIDDIVDSGETLCNAAFSLKKKGAKSVISCITHGLFSRNAIEKILSSRFLDKLIITDTIFHELFKNSKIEIVSIVDFLIHFIRGDSNVR